MIPFLSTPDATDRPETFPSPFARTVHPLARRAAEEVMSLLGSPAAEGWGLHAAGAGKMFGVLVVTDPAGRVGYLRGFSGTLGGEWRIEGWAPPTFDVATRNAVWVPGESEMTALKEHEATLLQARAELEARHSTLRARQAEEQDAMRLRHRAARERRKLERARGAGPDALHQLEQESRRDKAERRALIAAQLEERAPIDAELRVAIAAHEAIQRHRAHRSGELLRGIQNTYGFRSARGEFKSLRAIFSPDEPPGGAGDCAAPRLLAHAYALGLQPVALAEFWWGSPPRTVDRRSGAFYAACRGKCAPILAHMLDGLVVEAAPVHGGARVLDSALHVVFEDDWILVVDKPCGLLSVPGRSAHLHDSVLTRLRALHPHATGPLLVHRLDLDTSGLLVAAKDQDTFVALQRYFAERRITKRYVALLEGLLPQDEGTVNLALRVDLDDRPRQLHDPLHGKDAVTHYRVLARQDQRTRVEFTPLTGRTHQLRVHASHPLGLNAPIVGDRLYGRVAPDESQRLMLHAASLQFAHPATGADLTFESEIPF